MLRDVFHDDLGLTCAWPPFGSSFESSCPDGIVERLLISMAPHQVIVSDDDEVDDSTAPGWHRRKALFPLLTAGAFSNYNHSFFQFFFVYALVLLAARARVHVCHFVQCLEEWMAVFFNFLTMPERTASQR